MVNKGVVAYFLCTNPGCSFSENKLIIKKPVTLTGANYKFKLIESCPKCKSQVELLNFVSGTVEIEEDKIEQEVKSDDENSED